MNNKPTYEELEQRIRELEQIESDRKHEECKFIKERDFISNVLYWIDSLVVVIDINGHIISFNRASEQLSGYRFEELQGRPFWEILLTSDEREEVKTTIKDVHHKELPKDFRNHWVTKAGEKRLIHWNNSILEKADGSVEYILCTGLDITERQKAETALLESEEKYRELVQNANSIIIRIDTNGKFTFFNEYAQKIFGYTEEEIIGKSVVGTILPDTDTSGRNLTSLLSDIIDNPNRYVTYENENMLRNGQRIWVSWTNKIIFDKKGDIQGILCIGNNITDRKKAEEKLLQSETTYRILAENPNSIVMRFDSEGNILFVNKYASDLFGYTNDEMIGKKSTDLIHSRNKLDRAKAKEFFTDLLENPEKYRTNENENITKDGKVLWISWTNTPTYEEDGTFSGLISTGFDITERKQAEEQKAKLESHLRQAQKMEAVGTLAGGIAHDFNNILFPLIGYSEMLREDLPADSPLQGHVDGIFQAALRSKNLVKQILLFSRQGDQDLKAIKLQPIVKEALKLLRSSIPTTIDIQQNITPGCGIVVADPTQIHQIVMNLATNAYHAMEETGGRLKVDLRQTRLESDQSSLKKLVPGEYALLSVTDTGIGIEKNVMDKMFDPYFTTKKAGKGTGLGLSVLQGLIQNCNGDIRIHSEPGKGTEAQVYLPIVDQSVDNKPKGRNESIQGGTEKILIVDDEETIVKMEQQMLERMGYRVTIRTGSLEALEAFKANPDSFDLIVTDMTMPNMTGIQLAGEIKKIRSDIPIILCTGFSYQINAESSKAMGIQGFVMKPVVMREIAGIIRKVLGNSEEG